MFDFSTMAIFIISTLVVIFAGGLLGHSYKQKLSWTFAGQIIVLMVVVLFMNFLFEIGCGG